MDEQMTRLWERCRGGDEAARSELVLAHLPLVRFVLGRLPVARPLRGGLGPDDLLGAGVIALLRAIGDFDSQRGVEFATFAVPRIRGAMLDELRAHDILPRSVRERAAAIEAASADLRRAGRLAPSIEEIAERTGLTPPQVQQTMSALGLRSQLSLDAFCRPASGGGRHGDGQGEERVLDRAADRQTPSPLAALLAKERDCLLSDAIAELPPAERRVIVLYYRHNLMLKEIAKVLSVTKSRISQLHSRALFRLRERIETAPRRGLARAEAVLSP